MAEASCTRASYSAFGSGGTARRPGWWGRKPSSWSARKTTTRWGTGRLASGLTALVNFEPLSLAAGVVLLAPFTPMLFMGEEYGETAPFFTSPTMATRVSWKRCGGGGGRSSAGRGGGVRSPGPRDFCRLQAAHPFARGHRWPQLTGRSNRQHTGHRNDLRRDMRDFYRAMLAVRRRLNRIVGRSRRRLEAAVNEDAQVLAVRRWGPGGWAQAVTVFISAPLPCLLSCPRPADPSPSGPGPSLPRPCRSSCWGAVPWPADHGGRFPRRGGDEAPKRARELSWTVVWHDGALSVPPVGLGEAAGEAEPSSFLESR